MAVAVLSVGMITAGCSDGAGGPKAANAVVPRAVASATVDQQRADANLVLTMYDDITRAFQRNPDDGVRAIIAAQDPQDRADVDFARCVNAISPGAKSLPRSKAMHFVPDILTMTADEGYTLTSDKVTGLHPKGRIYVTQVTITDGGRPTVRERHQVVLDGKAYQFSTC